MSLLFILENNLDLFYVVTDLEANIITNNSLFKSYASHIQPKKITDIVDIDSDKEDFIDAIKKAISQSPEPVRVYARTKHKNLSHRYNIWNCFAIGDRITFLGVQLVDVTSITAHEYQRQRALLEEFRFMLSHEIRQPFASINSLTKMLRDTPSETEQLALLDMVDSCVLKLDEAIKNLVRKASREI
jgi:signal transduction histidine kinase